MKQVPLLLFLMIMIVSCRKNRDEQSGPLQAETMTNVSYGTDPANKMDIYLPAGRTDTTKLIILVHGGAWVEGDKADFNSFVSVIQQRLPEYAIANINYRLATAAANHFPAQEEDMKNAINFLVQKAGDYHISQKIVLLGASAGAQMVLLQAYKNAAPPVKAVVDFFGPVNLTDIYNATAPGSINQLAIQILMGGTPTSNPATYQQASPINFVTAQSPPTLILHGDMDALVNIAQSLALKNKLQSLSVSTQMYTYAGYGHELWPPAIMNDAYDKVVAFIRQYVK